MDFVLSQEQTMIYEYGASLAKTYAIASGRPDLIGFGRLSSAEQATDQAYLRDLWSRIGTKRGPFILLMEEFASPGDTV